MIGLNHRSTALATRERAAIGPDALPKVVAALLAHENIEGVAALSTCNRSEIYFSPTYHFEDGELRALYAAACGLSLEEGKSAYIYRDAEAVRHLCRVASGLDSQMLGEVQILAQVKAAYARALDLACTTGTLNRLFTQAISCGKLVRTRTAISQGAVSVAYAAIEVAQRFYSRFDEARILLVGAGETVRLAAKYLTDAGAKNWRVSNRTRERGEEFASSLGGDVTTFPPEAADIEWADVVLCATSATEPVIRTATVGERLRSRKRALLFLDLAVPRDVEATLARIDDVYLYTVDDFQELVAANVKARQKEAVRAEEYVEKEVEEFVKWYRQNRIAPSIHQLQMALESIRAHEVEQQARHFRPEDRDEVEKFSRAMMSRVTSLIVANMRRASADGEDLTLARAVTVAFAGKDPRVTDEILEKLNHELSH
jgi:glutamyl-tRNA reductase